MKKLALFVTAIVLVTLCSCWQDPNKEVTPDPDPNDPTTQVAAGYWKYAAGDSFLAANSTFNGTQAESDCNDNNKMWIVLGAVPTANIEMKIVSYSKMTLASDELKIDISHGADDYLSSGADSAKATVEVANGKLSINFSNVRFQKYGSMGPTGDSTTITGYLDQK